MCPMYLYECNCCGLQEDVELSVDKRDTWNSLPCAACDNGALIRRITACSFAIHGASAANGYSTNVADIEKRLGREITNEDMPY